MDLLGDQPELDLQSRKWVIYSVNPNRPPQYIAGEAEVENSMINKGTQVMGKVKNSVLFFGVKIGRDAVVENSVVLPNTCIASGSQINNSIIGRNVNIEKNSQIGIDSQTDGLKITVIGDDELIPENSKIKSGTVVG
nr:hypothetical protein [Halanaerobium hydrogeniformans]